LGYEVDDKEEEPSKKEEEPSKKSQVKSDALRRTERSRSERLVLSEVEASRRVKSIEVRCYVIGFSGYDSSFLMIFCVVGLVLQYLPVAAFCGADAFDSSKRFSFVMSRFMFFKPTPL